MTPAIPPALFAPQPWPAVHDGSRDPLAIARTALLSPAGLDEDGVARILGEVMGRAVDYADVYFQLIREESWALEDSIVKDGAHSIDQGVGVRALSGEKTGFAYSDEVAVLPALLEAAHAARAIARSSPGGSMQAWRARGGHGLYLPIDPVESLDDDAKVRLLETIDREARALDPRISQVMASLIHLVRLRRTAAYITTPHSARLFAFANVTLQALTCFCLFGRWPKIQSHPRGGWSLERAP